MDYSIADHRLTIHMHDDRYTLDALLPSMRLFRVDPDPTAKVLFTLIIEPRLQQSDDSSSHLVKDVDTGNGIISVRKLNDVGYQFVIHDIYGTPCALLQTSDTYQDCRCSLRGGLAMRRFALSNVLMLVYAFSSAYDDTLLVHASVVRHAGHAIAFTANSGTGKSSPVANWLTAIHACDILNDDNPIVRLMPDGSVMIYGSPWSGKTPCYRNVCAPLAALVKIERDKTNHVTVPRPLDAFIILLTACSAMRWDETLYQRVCNTVSAIVASTRVLTLHCLPDKQSAEVCRHAVEE